MVAGHAFDVTVALSASSENASRITEQVLAAVVKAYNDSGNPGRFELRILNGGTFDIVPIAASDGKQKPILDTVMSFEAKDTDSADVTLTRFCAELGRQSRQPVKFWGFDGMASNRLMQETIDLDAKNQPAREILRQMLREIGRTWTWRVLYEPDLRSFLLELR